MLSPAVKSPTFRWIASVYTANLLLEWVGSIALMVLVYGETQSATAAAALLIAKQVIPGALMPLAGDALDRLPAGRVLPVGLLVQAALSIAIVGAGAGILVLVLAGFSGLAGGVVRSVMRASIARALQGDELAAGNALVNVAVGIVGFAGPALAALALTQVGIGVTMQALGVAFAILAVAATRVPFTSAAPDAAEAAGADGEPTPSAERLPSTALPLTGLLATVGLIACVFAMDEPALLPFSERSLGAGVGGYSAIIVAWGVGITIGSLIFTRMTRMPLLRVYVLATILAALGYIGLGLAPTITVACVIAVIGGIGNGMDWVAVVTLVQQATPKGREAWAATRVEAICTAGPGLGILLGGALADVASPRLSLLVPGVLALLALGAGGAALRLRAAAATAAPASAPARPAHSLSPSIHGGSA